MSTPTSNTNTKCLFCKLDLSTRKGFDTREDKDTIKFCSSKCRKADLRNNARSRR